MRMITEEYNKLIHAIKHSDNQYKTDDLEMLDDLMGSFGDYVDIVYQETYRTPILRARLDGDELRQRLQQMDMQRRIYHDSAISSCSQINKLCEIYGVEPICPITNDRYVIADYCAQISAAFYLNGIGKDQKTIDNVLSAMRDSGTIIKKQPITRNIDEEMEL